jgi:MFS family permease
MANAADKRLPLVVILTAFLDLIGFSIIFPLFPQMLEHYLELEGAASMLGRGVALLRDAAAGSANAEFLVTVLFGGILGSLYSILQFLFAPFWGGLSDRIGRRPTILITLTGTALSYVGWFFAGSFGMLVFARLLGGAMAGNLSTVSAVVSDTTTVENRAKGMGMVGAAIGLGFILGPALGGFSTLFDLTTVWPGGVRFGLNPFSGAALIALILSCINLSIAVFRFPETLPPDQRGRSTTARTANPITMIRGVSEPGVQLVNGISFLFLTAFSAMEFTLVFLTVERFAYTPRDNAGMFVFVGLMIALVQGGLLRRLAPALGEKRLVQIGVSCVAPGFLLVAMAGSSTPFYLGLAAMAFGSALVIPSTSALVSKYAPEAQQGFALGLHRSAGALSRAVGPLLGGTLYWRFGASTPYVVSAVFLALPLAMSFGLPKLQSD